MDSPEITELPVLIDKLGGPTAAARKLNARYASVVSMWVKRGNIPPALVDMHQAILLREGITANRALWGIKSGEAAA